MPAVALVSGLPHPLSTVITQTQAICVVEEISECVSADCKAWYAVAPLMSTEKKQHVEVLRSLVIKA